MTDLNYDDYLDRSVDLVARVRATKEAAQRKIEEFGDPSEYEITKIYGQLQEAPTPTTEESTPPPAPLAAAEIQTHPRPAQSKETQGGSQRQTTLEFVENPFGPGTPNEEE